jgi:hypothetical protein
VKAPKQKVGDALILARAALQAWPQYLKESTVGSAIYFDEGNGE